MTTQEILDYFGGHTVYQWNGTKEQLHDAQLENNASYNTLIVAGVIYFVSHGVVTDSRAVVLTA